jgi:predicted nuclease of restriction endonuclease-like (RecB) superfamily
MKNDPAVLATSDYRRFIEDLKARVTRARISAARHLNRDLILLYWDIGRAIVEKQKTRGWGDSVVEMVAADLRRAFPEMRGFSPDSIWRMRQFYSEYADASFLEQAVPEIERRVGKRLEQAVPERPVDEFLSLFVREMLASIPWGHHVELLKKIKDPLARLWYLQATARRG